MNTTTEHVSVDQLPCRCCRKSLASFVQPPLRPNSGRKARTYVTCWNESCLMYGYTVDGDTYADKDLSIYIGAEESEDDEPQPCGDCRDGMVEGFNRRGGWAIANYKTCPTCGGSGVVRS